MERLLQSLNQCKQVYGNINIEQLEYHLRNAVYVDIYTDGATQYNGQRQSGIGVYFGDNDIRNVSKLVNTYDNNECEILACIEALSIVKEPYIKIYTDSRLVVDVMHGDCKLKGKKYNLMIKLKQLLGDFIDVQFIYVKGHNGNDGNEKADALSRLQFK